jgi:hypothetical protein
MSDPVRLRDDPALPKARQRLLRSGEVPLDLGYDEGAGLARLRSAIEATSAVRPRARVSFLAPAWSVLKRATTGSAWVWIALPAAATGVWAVQRSTSSHRELTVEHRLAPAPAPVHQAGKLRMKPTPVVEPPVEAPLAAEPSAVPVAPAPSHKAAPESKDSALLAETTQMAELRRAQSDPARALALANEGARQFPRGFFAQEREAIAITSLLRLGRTAEARARGERFLARHPQGPAAEQIRRALGPEP